MVAEKAKDEALSKLSCAQDKLNDTSLTVLCEYFELEEHCVIFFSFGKDFHMFILSFLVAGAFARTHCRTSIQETPINEQVTKLLKKSTTNEYSTP